MSKKLPSIIDTADSLLLLDSSIIALNSSKFFGWLENNQSFRFDCGLAGKDGYTARKERSEYWYAYKKIAGKLHKRYIGTHSEITIPKLLEVAHKLQSDAAMQLNRQLQKEVKQQLQTNDNKLPNEVVQDLYATIQKIQQALTALTEKVEALETAKKPESSPVEGIDAYTIQLGKRVNELEAINRDLEDKVERLHRELDIARCGVAVEVIEVSGLNAELESELETAKQRIAQLEETQVLQLPESQPERLLTPQVNSMALEDFLATLKLGKQSPDYKAAKRWITRFVEFVDPSLKL